ncbi:MAG: leucine-rich repeat protein, partial [Oscillospiraceae bacterium]|nr:leucine-rich repeat protein [Oscillospiraceae bacterium]
SLPEGLLTIGYAAFSSLSALESITLPASVTSISSNAFYGTGLKSIVIPDGVTAISSNTFQNCASLVSVTIPASVASISSAFGGCSALTDVYYLGTQAQWDRVAISSGNDYLTEATLHLMSLASGDCGEDLTWTLDADGTLTISGTGDMTDFSRDCEPWYDQKANVKAVVIEPGVTSIGNDAFSEYTALESVELPAGLTRIGEYAFYGCTALAAADLPSSLSGIGTYAFGGCSALEAVSLPDAVTSIGSYAFYGCTSLQSVRLSAGLSVLDFGVFSRCASLTAVVIPDGVTTIKAYCFQDCTSLQSVSLPAGLTEITSSLFERCGALTEIVIPSGVTSIGQNAFYRCAALGHVTLPGTLESVAAYAFYGCEALAGVTFLGTQAQWDAIDIHYTNYALTDAAREIMGVSGTCGAGLIWTLSDDGTLTISGSGEIGNYDWLANNRAPWDSQKDDIKAVVIEEGVTSIGDCAFYNCSSLASVTIPSSVMSIGSKAFFQCYALTAIYINDLAAWCGIAFASNPMYYGPDLYLHDLLVQNLVIPSGVTSISSSAFADYAVLTSVTIPEEVTSIGAEAFRGCSELTSVTIPSSMESIDRDAFSNCPFLSDVYFLGTQAQWDALEIDFGNDPLTEAALHVAPVEGAVPISTELFPDDAFRGYVEEQFDADHDGWLSPAEIDSVTEIECIGLGVASLQGVEIFSALEYLACGGDFGGDGQLTAVDLRANTKLRELDLSFNSGLTSLDLTGLSGLRSLSVGFTGLTELELSPCPLLERLICNDSALSALDLSVTPELAYLDCCGNAGLTELDISGCPNLLRDYLAGGRRIGWMESMPELYESIVVYGGSNDEDYRLAVNTWVRILTGLAAPVLDAAVKLDHDYLLLAPGDEAQLALVGLEDAQVYSVTWSVVDQNDAAADPVLIEVDGDGLVRAGEHMGTNYVLATVRDDVGGVGYARCRVDVVEAEPAEAVSAVRLLTTAATAELYKTAYTRIQVLPELAQNNVTANAAQPTLLPTPEPEADRGAAVEAARFADPTAAARFTLRVVDDRTLEIVPTAGAINGTLSTAKSYSSAIIVTVDGREFTTAAKLKLTVKKTLPTIKAKAITLNSYLTERDVQDIVFTGGTVLSARLDPNKAAPAWLQFDEEYCSVTYTGVSGAKQGKATLNLLVAPESWCVERSVAVTVSAKSTAPAITFKAKTLTLKPGTLDKASTTYTIKPALFAEEEVTVSRITEGKGKTLQTYGNDSVLNVDIYDGSLTVSAPRVDSAAHTYTVYLSVQGRESSFTVKTLAESKAVSLKLSLAKNAKAIDLAVPGSPVIVNVTAANFHLDQLEYFDVVGIVNKSAPDADAAALFDYTVTEDGRITVTAASDAVPTGTYVLTAEAGYGGAQPVSATVTFTVKRSAKTPAPTVKLTAGGSIDVLRPGTAVTVKPTMTNLYLYELAAGDVTVTKTYDGGTKKKVTVPATELFDVQVRDGAYVITQKSGAAVSHADKYSVQATVAGVASKAVTLKVVQGKAKLGQSTKAVTLLKTDRFSRGEVTLTPTDAALAIREVKLVSPADKSKTPYFDLVELGGGAYAVKFNGD